MYIYPPSPPSLSWKTPARRVFTAAQKSKISWGSLYFRQEQPTTMKDTETGIQHYLFSSKVNPSRKEKYILNIFQQHQNDYLGLFADVLSTFFVIFCIISVKPYVKRKRPPPQKKIIIILSISFLVCSWYRCRNTENYWIDWLIDWLGTNLFWIQR